jgi:uncharacterized repeat protein (TIGR01451 family)
VLESPVVGFEISKGQFPDDISDFLADIMAQGYSLGTVDMTAGPIPDCVDILIVHGLANNRALSGPYTAGEGDTLKTWAANGHGLMLSGDWGNFKTGTQALFQTYGYSQLGGAVRDPTDFDPAGPAIDPAIWVIYQTDNFANHPILDGATSLQLQASSWLTPDTKAIVTADADAQPVAAPVMAAFTDGAGCVALITDSNWYATDGGEGGYLKPATARVARQMVKWLNGCMTLTLTKFAAPSPVLAGQVLTYTLTVANNSDSLLTDVLITDVVPTNTSFIAATYPHNGPNTSGVITWSLDILDISALAVVTMVVQVDSAVPTGTFIINTAGVTSKEGLADTTMAMVEVLAFTSTPTPTITPIPTAANTPIPTNTPTPTPPSMKSYLPLIIHIPPTFPLFIGDAIPVRSVAFQGETFYSTTIQIPARLPPAGSFYLSSEPDQVSPVLVDDDLVILLNDIEHFTYHFSAGGRPPQPAIVEVPRETMEPLAGQTVIVQYRDVYGDVVEASPMWLIWVP